MRIPLAGGAGRSALLAIALLLLALPALAHAATIQVNTQTDPTGAGCAGGTCSLRQAIAVAGASDTIAIPTGHYTLDSSPGVLLVDHDIQKIQGTGDPVI